MHRKIHQLKPMHYEQDQEEMITLIRKNIDTMVEDFNREAELRNLPLRIRLVGRIETDNLSLTPEQRDFFGSERE